MALFTISFSLSRLPLPYFPSSRLQTLLPVLGGGSATLVFSPRLPSASLRASVRTVFFLSFIPSFVKMSDSEWKVKCETEWKLQQRNIGVPDSLVWKAAYEKKPFNRNLLKNPKPQGLSHTDPLPAHVLDEITVAQFEQTGDFIGWTTSTEHLPVDKSGIPPGAVVCYLPMYSWFSLEQRIDLMEEGLWEELMDAYQPDICIQDWYEDSKIHEFIYQLNVKLLGADGETVIQEYSHNPQSDRGDGGEDSHSWIEVSHIFQDYGSGVRYIHFLHRVKNMRMVDFQSTRVTDTSVVVKLRD
ncbi:F-box only protein 50 [Erpetoichthys calabaricus]|uniref:P1, F-box associated domain containing n=1 Tax=Erpetoichthys calabaricus TaxID=27687 RepID=A0A8C4RE36_ERPCA|nr:F-box only protein 50 [Erpetoichthys calabaricus]